jgi:hypothetical protein
MNTNDHDVENIQKMLKFFQQGINNEHASLYVHINRHRIAIYNDNNGKNSHAIENMETISEVVENNPEIELKFFFQANVALSCLKEYYLNSSVTDIQWFAQKNYMHMSLYHLEKIVQSSRNEDRQNILGKILPHSKFESDNFFDGVIAEDLNLVLALTADMERKERLKILCQFAINNAQTKEDYQTFKTYLIANHENEDEKNITRQYLSHFPGIEDYLGSHPVIISNPEEKVFHFQVNGYKVLEIIGASVNTSSQIPMSINSAVSVVEDFFNACVKQQANTDIHKISMVNEYINNEQNTFIYGHTFNAMLTQEKIMQWFMEFLQAYQHNPELKADSWLNASFLYNKLNDANVITESLEASPSKSFKI